MITTGVKYLMIFVFCCLTYLSADEEKRQAEEVEIQRVLKEKEAEQVEKERLERESYYEQQEREREDTMREAVRKAQQKHVEINRGQI